MKIAIEITDDKIQNLFDSVLGDAYSGWCEELSADQDENKNWRGKIKYDRENEPEGSFKGRKKITNSAVKNGLEKMAVEFPFQFSQVLGDNIDAIAADCFMQSLVFGREVYA